MKKELKIVRWFETGELDGYPADAGALIEQAGRLLDKSCAHYIVGGCLFQAEDGKFYRGTVEFVIDEVDAGVVESHRVDNGLGDVQAPNIDNPVSLVADFLTDHEMFTKPFRNEALCERAKILLRREVHGEE
jgi:hypothetical protein